jgi:hypothetical protein
MEGELYKWTNYLFGWRQRYFVLKGSVLHYYYQRGEKPRGRIHLGVCQINSGDGETKIELDTGINVIYLKAESKEIKEEWVKAFRNAKKESENKQGAINKENQINQNLNSFRGEINQNFMNAGELNSHRNALLTEDKLLSKINQTKQVIEKLDTNNRKFEKLKDKGDLSPELIKLYSDYKVKLQF